MNCLDCEWQIQTDVQPSDYERTMQAINHHIPTGHTVVRQTGEASQRS